MIVQDAVTGRDVRHRLRWSYDRLAVAFLVLLAVLPAVLAALYVRAFGVNVPMWDQWYLVPMIEKFYRGRLSLGDFFDQFYEHRLFFPRVAMLVVVALARWNVLVEMYFDLVLMAISVAVIYLMYVRYHPPSISSLAIFLPVPWLFFSFRQWDNLLWGWQIQWYMAITFFLISMYFLDSARRIGLRFVLAAVSASIGSLSLADGLMTWPVGHVHLY